jgi:hypothetical protein
LPAVVRIALAIVAKAFCAELCPVAFVHDGVPVSVSTYAKIATAPPLGVLPGTVNGELLKPKAKLAVVGAPLEPTTRMILMPTADQVELVQTAMLAVVPLGWLATQPERLPVPDGPYRCARLPPTIEIDPTVCEAETV